jgi:two-component system chemotaxis response regulator CheB
MAEVPVITRARRGSFGERRIDIVGIVASTGGPLALAHIFAALPSNLPVPILVAQHIAEGFTEGLIRWLSNVSKLTVQVAMEGVTPRPGNVYFPPDQRDLEIAPDRTLRTPKSTERYAPSGDRLLGSIAHAYASRCAGVVLTGMGDDGAAGLLAIRQAGGNTLAQSQESCVVFGMPHAAMTRGATTDLRSLAGLSAALVELAGPPRRMPTVTGH